MEKVAVYASFKNQNSKSIQPFLKLMADYCLMKNYDYTIYLDKVKSRLDVDRKELNSLIEDIKQNMYSKVIIRDIRHLSRDTIFNIKFLQLLEDNNCELESIDGMNYKLYKDIFNKFKNKEEKER